MDNEIRINPTTKDPTELFSVVEVGPNITWVIGVGAIECPESIRPSNAPESAVTMAECFYTSYLGEESYTLAGRATYTKEGIPTGCFQEVSKDVTDLWLEALGTDEWCYEWDRRERARVFSMTTIEYRNYKREQLESESKPGHFAFDCEVSGTTYSFDIDDSDRIDVIGQLTMGATEVEIHDIRRKHEGAYNALEAGLIMTELAKVTREHKYPYDERIKALYELPSGFTKEDVDAI